MLIDGKAIAARIRAELSEEITALAAVGVVPGLAIVVATDDGGTAYYVRSLVRTAERLGIAVSVRDLGPDASREEIRTALATAGDDPSVHGVICQTPLPAGIALADIADAIRPEVDVDGANPTSLGRLAAGVRGAFPPATAAAVMRILDAQDIPLVGRRAVVVGRSNVVGKPLAFLLLERHATVTVCHSRTCDLPGVTRGAEILVAAVGQARLLTAEHVGPGAVVIDVGTNATQDGGLLGDVDTGAVEPVAAAVTPVPGGVGAVTTAVLMSHVVQAAARRCH
jgi:methylenetetrahydrofolate dehydrogenase (NADP+) / methenyltetrahydrofolate cyclohydrolase